MFNNCEELPPEEYDNPLDTLGTIDDDEIPIETPALIFFPEEVTVSVGASTTIQVMAFDVDNLAGSYIKILFDENKLNLLSVSEGDLFDSGLGTIFLYKNDGGTLEIYTSYLGDDTTSVSGTGKIADLIFSTRTTGESTLSFSDECEFVDSDNDSIVILGYSEGMIYAK